MQAPGVQPYQFGAMRKLEFQPPTIPNAPSFPTNVPLGPASTRQSQANGRGSGGSSARGRGQGRGRCRGRGRADYFLRASDRPLLQSRESKTPEPMGVSNSEERRFKHPDELSESSEDSTEGDADQPAPDDATPAKPTWTSAEFFTALPPPDAGPKKKRNILRLIRKARVVASEKVEDEKDQVKGNIDYIAFDSEPDEAEESAASRNALVNGSSRPGYAVTNGGPTSAVATNTQPVQKATDTHRPAAIATNAAPVVNTTIVARLDEDRKRKRSLDLEDTVPLKQPKLTVSTSKRFTGGSVLNEWKVKPDQGNINPLPWLAEQHHPTGPPNLRYVSSLAVEQHPDICSLHKEICDFFDFVKPRPFEEAMRQDLLQRLQQALGAVYPNCAVRSFGSFAAGLYLPNADMDVVVISQTYMDGGLPQIGRNPGLMHKLAGVLISKGLAERSSIEVIAKAKVPLIKFLDIRTSLRVDLSCENLNGIVANRTFQEWKAQYPAMPIIVTLIKQFLLMRGMNEVHNGGLGGFSVTCLVTSLLQLSPRIQTGELVPEIHLGEILLEFLDLYGNHFDYERVAIKMRPASLVDKASPPCHELLFPLSTTLREFRKQY